MQEKITEKLYRRTFADVLSNGGSKEDFKLPSYINKIRQIGFFISNPILNKATNTYAYLIKQIFPALHVSLMLFSQNNSIIDYSLINNEFIFLENYNIYLDTVDPYTINNVFSLQDVLMPIYKENKKNTKTKIVFKPTADLLAMRNSSTYSAFFASWQPTIEMYVAYI
jgi:hypothetical protein